MNLLPMLPDIDATLLGYLSLLAVCSLRLYIILFMCPASDDSVLQGVVRNGVVLVFSSFVAYGQPASFVAALHGAVLIETALREMVIGLVIGFAASSVFWVAQGAGTYIDDLTGYNNVQISNPSRPETFTPTGTLLGQIAIVAFWTLGGMMFLLDAVYESYHWWPIASTTPVAANILEAFAMQQTDSLMQGVAKLALPVMFILLLIDLGFGLVAKSAQKLDLLMLSQPVKGILTVVMLALFVGLFVDQLRDQLVLRGLAPQLRAVAHQTSP